MLLALILTAALEVVPAYPPCTLRAGRGPMRWSIEPCEDIPSVFPKLVEAARSPARRSRRRLVKVAAVAVVAGSLGLAVHTLNRKRE